MNQKWLLIPALFITLAAPFRAAATLEFMKVQSVPTSATLNAVAYDGSSNFVAVGTDSATVRTINPVGSFNANNWAFVTVPSVPSNGLNLKALAFGQNLFVASGSNNAVFISTDNGGSWNPKGYVFTNATVEIDGLAFNDDAFVAVSASLDRKSVV